MKIRKDKNSTCSSDVGLKTKNPQTVYLGNDCLHLGIVIHELAHTLGLIHEHQRPDYRDHIDIMWENIQMDKLRQFKFTEKGIPVTLSPFDVHSITFYESDAFRRVGALNDTIIPKNPNVTLVNSSEKPGLSEMDILGLNRLYNCTTVETKNH